MTGFLIIKDITCFHDTGTKIKHLMLSILNQGHSSIKLKTLQVRCNNRIDKKTRSKQVQTTKILVRRNKVMGVAILTIFRWVT